jgi:hypothetical protein
MPPSIPTELYDLQVNVYKGVDLPKMDKCNGFSHDFIADNISIQLVRRMDTSK